VPATYRDVRVFFGERVLRGLVFFLEGHVPAMCQDVRVFFLVSEFWV
jgi:hypothetical protein